jgi:hypothetical protein
MTSNRISSSLGFTRVLAHRARRNFSLAGTVFVSALVLLGVASAPASAMPKPTQIPTASVTAVQLPNSVAPDVFCAVSGEDSPAPGLSGDLRYLSDDGKYSVYGSADGLIDGSRGGFILEPPCPTKRAPSGRSMTLVLTDAASLTLANASPPTCGRIWLVVPGPLATAQIGDKIGLPAPLGTSTGNSVFVYFEGTQEVYNLIWQAGIYVTDKIHVPGTKQTTFVLSTRATVSTSDVSNNAELINHSTSTSLGTYCVPLDLRVVVTQ